MNEEKRPVRLYLAILNKGRVRREVVQRVIPEIQATPGVELVLEPLSRSWAEPIFSNRNGISHRFMLHRPKCDYLGMIDDDVVPQQNFADLIFADKDVISVATKVRQPGRMLNWNAYVKHPILRGYSPIDFSRVDSSFDLLQCGHSCPHCV